MGSEDDARAAEHLDGTLTPADDDALAASVAANPSCAAEIEELECLWRTLGGVRAAEPDSARLRMHVDAVIAGYQAALDDVRGPSPFGGAEGLRQRRWIRHAAAGAAAAAALVLVGVLIGRQPPPRLAPDPQIESLRRDLHDMQQVVTLSLLKQPSASERLKGVMLARQLERPGEAIQVALLDSLMHDPNVNVRLSSVDALQRFAGHERVRRAAVDALARQSSPLVQIALIDFVIGLEGRDSIETLRRLSRDPRLHETVRQRAAWGVQRMG